MFNDDDLDAPTDGGAIADMPAEDKGEEADASSGEEGGNSGM